MDFLKEYKHIQVKLAFFGHDIKFDVASVLVAVSAIFVASRVFKLLRGLRAVSYMPGLRIPFQPLAFPGAVLPTTWWNPGLQFQWTWHEHFYKQYNSENVSVVPFISGVPVIYTSNLDVARQVSGHKTSFIKPESAGQSLLMWGMNLIVAEGDVWRKHRRVVAPAFTNQLYEKVWGRTIEAYHEMVHVEGWLENKVTSVPVMQKLTFKLALLIIGSCGFGFPFTWSEEAIGPDGSTSIQEALRVVADSSLYVLAVPEWVKRLPIKKMQDIRRSHEQVMSFMRRSVVSRRAEINLGEGGNNDAFSMLVRASDNEESKYKLDDQELIGNVYAMLFAGHETTAHTLAITLGFLAVNPGFQDEIVKEILEVMGKKGEPTLEDYPKLNKVRMAFFEALRMLPPGYVMIREAKEDTVLQIPKPVGQEGTTPFPVPKGVQVIVDMVGVQYNPRYFEDPDTFKPSRWQGIPAESELFSAFSIGPRACIGRKFATIESVCFLSMLLRDWRVEPKLNEGETSQEWGKRVLDARIALTLVSADVPLNFIRRA